MRILLASPHQPRWHRMEMENGQCRNDIRKRAQKPLHYDKRIQRRA